jgi:type IV pilus assembly protein PilQ
MMMRVAVPIALALLAVLTPAPAWSQEDGCGLRLPTDRTTIDIRSVDVQTTLRTIAARYRVSLIVTPEATGVVTVSLYEVPVRDAFDALVRTAGLVCVVRDDILVVRSRKEAEAAREQQRKEQEATAKADQMRLAGDAEARKRQVEARREEMALAELQTRGPLREETIRLAYADAADVAKTLLGILGLPPTGVIQPPAPSPGIYAPPPPIDIPSETPAGPPPAPLLLPGTPLPETLAKGITVSAHKPTNSVFIRHYEADLARIKRLVKEQLDVPLPQIQILAQMVVIVRNALEQLGVQWGGAAVGTANGNAVLGRGFSQPVNPVTGVATPQTTGVPNQNGPFSNPGLTGATILPVDPSTGLPTSGNVVNLPTTALPTLANPAMGMLFGIVGRNFNFNLAIQALETQGKARSLAEPKTVTVENATAIISRGFEVPYVSQSGFGGTQVQFKDALLKLEVTPRVIREADVTRIRMKVLVENNEPDFTKVLAGTSNPPIFKRRSENEVIVQEGERLVIGGVLTDSDTKTQREVPLLGRIPILGWLFKSRELSVDSQEMIVIITPTVVPAQRAR